MLFGISCPDTEEPTECSDLLVEDGRMTFDDPGWRMPL